jgi:pimeloyl-ACP methyl ester carboxylesterase
VSSPRLERARVRVQGRVAVFGTAGDGPPVLFLHGWGLNDHTYADGRLQPAGSG